MRDVSRVPPKVMERFRPAREERLAQLDPEPVVSRFEIRATVE